jgi:hypothetical protein
MEISATKTKSIGMYSSNIHRMKILLDNKVLEQVSEFKYLWYIILDCKVSVRVKLQSYTKKWHS